MSSSPAVTVGGDEVALRLQMSRSRLDRTDYTPDEAVARAATGQWPGDFPGRLILAWSQLSRIDGGPTEKLDLLVERLVSERNDRGYLGPTEKALVDEQQVAGHGWLVAGLLAHHRLTGEPTSAEWADLIVHRLLVPAARRCESYPTRTAGDSVGGGADGSISRTRTGWRLSTDTYCVLIGLEGLVASFERTADADVAQAISDMIGLVERGDLVATRAQLHASLTAARNFLRYHELTGDTSALRAATALYGSFRDCARTLNDGPYNWFGRPDSWIEPCAAVDAVMTAFGLWRVTGKAERLDEAYHGWFNSLGYAQKNHGGFGCDHITRVDQPILSNRIWDAWWCCSMRGAVGVAAVHDAAYHVAGSTIRVGIYQNGRRRLDVAGGHLVVHQTSDFPRSGQIDFEVVDVGGIDEVSLDLATPSGTSVGLVTLNGEVVSVPGGCLTWRPEPGDRLRAELAVTLRSELIGEDHHGHPVVRHLHGPALLGGEPADVTEDARPVRRVHEADSSRDGIVYDLGPIAMSPLYEVRCRDDSARAEQIQIAFAGESTT